MVVTFSYSENRQKSVSVIYCQFHQLIEFLLNYQSHEGPLPFPSPVGYARLERKGWGLFRLPYGFLDLPQLG